MAMGQRRLKASKVWPWTANADHFDRKDNVHVIKSGTRISVCCVHDDNIVGTSVHATARLIAAAPDLLEALKSARNAVHAADEEGDHPYTVSVLKKIDAAIAKATGQESAR